MRLGLVADRRIYSLWVIPTLPKVQTNVDCAVAYTFTRGTYARASERTMVFLFVLTAWCGSLCEKSGGDQNR